MKKQKIIAVLRVLNKKFKDKPIKWMLAGTTGLALQGVEISPNDIDILTDKEGAFQINELLKEYEVKPIKFRRSKIFESYFGKFKINGVEIDVMGNLRVKLDNGWVLVKLDSNVVEMKEMEFYVYPLHKALKAYKILERKKDSIRVQKIKEALRGG